MKVDPNQELIVYVYPDGSPTGETAPKLEAHTADTKLHSAFSCYIFNDDGDILVTQRAHGKKVWPSVWTNSVCGHPIPEELREDAVTRRSQYELGAQLAALQLILPNYTYRTPPYNDIIEHEFCPVYVARIIGDVRPNSEEVDDYKWMNWDDFVTAVKSDSGDVWSWWCKDQVKQLKQSAQFKTFRASF